MNKEELMKAVDTHKLLRTMGFPMLMPLVKGFNGDWEQAKPTIENIVSMHVNTKYDRLLKTLNGFYSKVELQDAFLAVIKRDFFDRGFTREKMILDRLIATNACSFVRYSTPEEECKGFDLIWTDKAGRKYAGSVKGHTFNHTSEYMSHINKLKKSLPDYDVIMIYMVDEINGKIKSNKVY